MDYVSLADFAQSAQEQRSDVPPWVVSAPLPLDAIGIRSRLEQILDTVTALQRADWLEDGVYIGPNAMEPTYRELLACARTLQVAVPPAVAAGAPMSWQNAYGTDDRSFLYLSTYLLNGTSPETRRFLLGRLVGKIAARQVTTTTLYGLLASNNGLRSVARRAVGPMLEVVMAPLSLGVRLALSRWHRSAELTADRAGLLCAGSLEAAAQGLLKGNLGMNPKLSHDAYLKQLARAQERQSPGRWTELLADTPWTHKRIAALQLFETSAVYARAMGREPAADAVDDDTLAQRTAQLLGVG
jgi:Zn-dependent protease with chaperone function